MKKKFVKLTTLLMAFVLVTGLFAVPAFADEADNVEELPEESISVSDIEDSVQADSAQDYETEQPVVTNSVQIPSENSEEEEAPVSGRIVQTEVPEDDQDTELPAAEGSADNAEYVNEDLSVDEVPAAESIPAGTENYENIYEEDAVLGLEADPVTSLATPKINYFNNIPEGTWIEWDEVKYAEEYWVYRKTAGGSWTKIGEPEEAGFLDSASADGKGYYYTVKAVSGSVHSDYADNIFNINIGKVTLKSCDADEDGIKVSWNSRSGATKYVVYRKTGTSGSWTRLAAVAATSYVDTTAVNGKTYYYTVSAYKSSGGTNYYGAHETPGLKYTKLATPKLTDTSSSSNGIKVFWDPVTGATGYRVYRKTSGGSWEILGRTNGTYYNDKTAKAGTTYYYTVRAYAGDSRSYYDRSGIKGYTLSKVKLESAYNVFDGITITWTALSTAQGYFVYRRTDSGDGWTRIGTTTDTSFTDTKAPAGTVYYTVRAYRTVDDVKYNGMFDADGISVEHITAPKLGSVSTNNKTPSITIKWGAVSGAKEYIVYRKQHNENGWSRIAIVTGTSYTDTAVNTSIDYYYTIRAVSDSGTMSGYDNSALYASFNPGPVLISATSNPSGIQLKWQAYQGAEGYVVYRKVGNETSWTRIAETTSTSYLDINAKAGKNNTYTVRAYYRSNGKWVTTGYNKKGLTCNFSDSVRINVANKMASLGITTLRGAYNYAANLPYKNRANGQTVVWYVKVALANSNADCHTKAAILCWMARELGYNAKVVDGYVTLSNGNLAVHGWVEIIIDGKTYVYDPEFQQEYPSKNGFKIVYGQKDTWKYSNWVTMREY